MTRLRAIVAALESPVVTRVHAGVCAHVHLYVVYRCHSHVSYPQPEASGRPWRPKHRLQPAVSIKTAFFSSSLQVKVTILLAVYPIANHHHGGQAQHDETACNGASKLDKTKTPMLDGSACRDPPPDSRRHHAAEAYRLGFIRGRLQRMAVCYREGKLPPAEAARTLSGRFRTHCSPATTLRPPYLARYRAAVLHVPILQRVGVGVVDGAELVPR